MITKPPLYPTACECGSERSGIQEGHAFFKCGAVCVWVPGPGKDLSVGASVRWETPCPAKQVTQ